jgi:hypothetical protein
LNLGHAAVGQGDIPAAESALQEALQTARQLGEKRATSVALHNLGLAALKKNDDQSARAYMLDALRMRSDLGDKVSIAYSLEGVATIAARANQPELSARLLGSAKALRTSIGSPLNRPEQEQYDQLVALVQQQLSPELFERESQAGSSMSLEATVAQALE